MTDSKGRVLVGLSGGVDSSVAAAILIEQGYDVEGAFIVPWQVPWLPCTWREERRDAIRVAAKLRIPFHTVDLSKEYERDVVRYLIREYQAGRTPNPDVMCNKYIKFGGFFTYAMDQGFDFVATGHYARIRSDGETYTLCESVDRDKDQTYFLWTLTQERLRKILFPIGELVKSEVRDLAATVGLPTAQKKDSQGICFLGKVDMRDFLKHYVDSVQGDVIDRDGRVIGSHEGALLYTLGQRHGFTVTHKTSGSPPLFVIDKDLTANTITVAPKETVEILPSKNEIALEQTNWIGSAPEHGARVRCRLRYRQPLFGATCTQASDGNVVVSPSVFQPFVPPGQSLVMYSSDGICLGGGIIS